MMSGIAVQYQKWPTGGVRPGEAQAQLPAGCNDCGACGQVAGLLAAIVAWSRGGLIAGRLSCLTAINPGRGTLALSDWSKPTRFRREGRCASTGRRQPGKLPQPRVILSDVMMIISDNPIREMRESKKDEKGEQDGNVGVFVKK